MKVIVAGYSKTGTKTMAAALTELGYRVYDGEHFMLQSEEWIKIFNGYGSVADFKQMYKNVDAVTDCPPCTFWKEIHEAFPEAKIILTIRDEDSWYKSLVTQFQEWHHQSVNYLMGFAVFVLPFMKRSYIFANMFAIEMTGRGLERAALVGYRAIPDPMVAKQRYRKHNADVLQGAPKEKILVFSVKEGWEPLCKFLEKEIPDKPFPWKNIGGKGQITKENIQHFNRKIMMELLTFLVAFLLLLLAVYFYANENDWWKSLLIFLLSFITWYKFLLYS